MVRKRSEICLNRKSTISTKEDKKSLISTVSLQWTSWWQATLCKSYQTGVLELSVDVFVTVLHSVNVTSLYATLKYTYLGVVMMACRLNILHGWDLSPAHSGCRESVDSTSHATLLLCTQINIQLCFWLLPQMMFPFSTSHLCTSTLFILGFKYEI